MIDDARRKSKMDPQRVAAFFDVLVSEFRRQREAGYHQDEADVDQLKPERGSVAA